MHLPLTLAAVSVTVLDAAGSTNDVVTARADQAAHFDTVLTTTQTAGRGRLGRSWVAPPGSSLAMSILLKPVGPTGELLDIRMWGWLPLLAGLAMSRTVKELVPDREVGLKWPNDVLIGTRKVSGILSELLPDASGVVVGAGLNLSIADGDLPTPAATSLVLEGCRLSGDGLVDAAASRYAHNLRSVVDAFMASNGDVETSGLRRATVLACSTIGRSVRVELPMKPHLQGTAIDIDHLGRLIVRTSDGAVQPVAAGDVTHVLVAIPPAAGELK